MCFKRMAEFSFTNPPQSAAGSPSNESEPDFKMLNNFKKNKIAVGTPLWGTCAFPNPRGGASPLGPLVFNFSEYELEGRDTDSMVMLL